jgi:GNAT superfamily N-acetyltransferase
MPTSQSYRITQVKSGQDQIMGRILRTLPEHFGFESAIVDLCEESRNPGTQTFVAFGSGDVPVGFLMLVRNTKDTAEVSAMGVLKEHQGGSVGSALLKRAEEEARKRKHKFLLIKTIGPKQKDPNFLRTYNFYIKNGYSLLDEWDYFWRGSWCALLLKRL